MSWHMQQKPSTTTSNFFEIGGFTYFHNSQKLFFYLFKPHALLNCLKPKQSQSSTNWLTDLGQHRSLYVINLHLSPFYNGNIKPIEE